MQFTWCFKLPLKKFGFKEAHNNYPTPMKGIITSLSLKSSVQHFSLALCQMQRHSLMFYCIFLYKHCPIYLKYQHDLFQKGHLVKGFFFCTTYFVWGWLSFEVCQTLNIAEHCRYVLTSGSQQMPGMVRSSDSVFVFSVIIA